MDNSLVVHARGVARFLRDGRAKCFRFIKPIVEGKRGLEIGGPTAIFRDSYGRIPIYDRVGVLDNCDFSSATTWATHAASYTFSPRRPSGTNIFAEGSNLSSITDHSYDFILSSHNLEHFANPVKALREWKRVTRPDGGLILILPYYLKTFDHRRVPTAVDHMFEDFDRNTQEDDLSHLPEILEAHDLSLDPDAGSFEQFHNRSLNNFANRCLHHHVFDEINSRDLLARTGMRILAVELVPPNHIFLVARMG